MLLTFCCDRAGIKTGRLLTHYFHRQNRLNLGNINLIYRQIKLVKLWETKMRTKNSFLPLLPSLLLSSPNLLSESHCSNWCFSIVYYNLRSLMSSSPFSLCAGPGSPEELWWKQCQWLPSPSFQWKGNADAGGWYEQWKEEECQNCWTEGFSPSDCPDKSRISTVPAHGQNISIKVEKSECWLIEELKSILGYKFKCNYFPMAAARPLSKCQFMCYPYYWNTFAPYVS